MTPQSPAHILVADDNHFVLESTVLLLSGLGFKVTPCRDARESIEALRGGAPDAVLTDIKMPGLSGLDLLDRIRTTNKEVPVIFMTAYADVDVVVDAIKKGAFDFIIKPYKPEHLVHAVEKAVKYARLVQMERNYKHRLEEDVRKRTAELADALQMIKETSKELVHRIMRISEFRDSDTGAHIKRIGLYSGRLARVLGASEDFVDSITFASPMHDIGKVGIPDVILLKPGALTGREFDSMKGHTLMGERMLLDSPYPSIQTAAVIARTHHERWDGSGYPGGLRGEDIPLEGRIVMIVDQYDALRSKRPYKDAMGHEEAVKVISKGNARTSPGHFDPRVLEAFLDASADFNEIFEIYRD
ncbi:MAG: response regulator [Thermodesulfobacteriota bacterium]|nr:MAG: response regulator [Thermodesulfobacteriota bacterium]